MKKPSLTAPVTEPSISPTPGYFIGIDYHKRYSAAGRIEAGGALSMQFRPNLQHWRRSDPGV